MGNRPTPSAERRQTSELAQIIFASRWLQVFLYLGLIVAQCVYVVLFVEELWHPGGMLWDPAAIDQTVQRLGITERNKETVIMLIVLSLIDKTLLWQTVIHVVFLGSALAIAMIDRVMAHAVPPGAPAIA